MLTRAAADGGESAGPGLRGTLRAIPAFLIPAGTLVPLLLRYGVTGFDRPKALAPAALGAGLLGPYTLAFELISVVLLAAMRKIIVPHPSRNLDFDFLYRAVGRGFVKLVSVPTAAVDNVWTDVYAKIGLRGLLAAGRGTSLFDGKGIDGVIDGSARGVREGGGATVARAQTGRIQDYLAAAVALGLLLFAAVWFLG